jgi:1-acyl-sn-glycerol-3-phosphate acyltransferase
MIFLRSLAFNVSCYLVTAIMAVAALPVFVFSPDRAGGWIVRLWASIEICLLRAIVGTRLVIRGIENLPSGGALVAAKHQSMFETFALFTVLDRPSFVMKRELARIPLWGWYAIRIGMITVRRDQGTSALRQLVADVGKAIAYGRKVVIFPEGTRRPPGAETDYKGGIAHVYRMTGASVVPVALNSGLFWPRRQFRRYPGILVIAFLPPIAPGLKSRDFMTRLENEIETASAELLTEAADAVPPPALLPEALARLRQRDSRR